MNRQTVSRLLSGLIVVLTVIGTIITLTNREEGILTVYGAENLKFFTVESNLLIGIVHLVSFLLPTEDGRIRLWLERLIYIATVAVSLTFVVVVAIFGPSIGYGDLFKGANLFFHLIIPLLAILTLCIFHRGRRIPMWETALALIPTVLYGGYYSLTLLLYGVHFPETDWYGFASGGILGSIVTASLMLLITWVLALVLRAASGGNRRGEIAENGKNSE